MEKKQISNTCYFCNKKFKSGDLAFEAKGIVYCKECRDKEIKRDLGIKC